MRPCLISLIFMMLMTPSLLPAQDYSLKGIVTLYGDNTEFEGDYREGETIFGAWLAALGEAKLSETHALTLGLWANRRHGSDDFMEDTWPYISFAWETSHSTFILGNYVPEKRHGYLEPIQVSTLELTRPVESGLSWTHASSRHHVHFFIDWQKLCTPDQREVFDSGLVTRFTFASFLDVSFQWHWWHQGGELTRVGRVINNNVGALGLRLHGSLPVVGSSSLQFHYLGSKITIDPAYPDRPPEGSGLLANLEVSPFRNLTFFATWWKGEDFLSYEGDRNYASWGDNPDVYRQSRKYAEIGVGLEREITPLVRLKGDFRFNRIDDRDIGLALRFTLTTRLSYPVRSGGD